jgi:hypothetical protein
MFKKNCIAIYWGVCLIALPFFILPITNSHNLELSRDIFLLAATVIGLMLFGIASKNLILPAAIIAYSFLNLWHYESDASLYQIIFLCVGLLVHCQLKDRRVNRDIIIKSIMIAGSLQALWVLLEVNEIEPYQLLTGLKQFKWIDGKWTELVGTKTNGSYANTNPTAAMIAICAPAMLQWPLLILMAAGALYFLGSANGIATFLAGIFFYFAATKLSKKLNIMALFSAILTPILAVPFLPRSGDFGASGRWEAWRAGIKAMSLGDWVNGKGIGWISSQFPEIYKLRGGVYFDKIHNEYLECLISLGVIGLILFIALFKNTFNRIADRPTLYAIFAASLVNSTLMFTYHISGIALIGIIAFTLLSNRE